MADLYTDLRDGTAANLIAKFGRAATLRKPTAPSYDPATGAATSTPQDTPVRVLEVSIKYILKGRTGDGRGEFEQEQVSLWDSGLIMSAKETAAADVEPEVGDTILLGTEPVRVAWVEPIRPSGVAIIYKLAISRR